MPIMEELQLIWTGLTRWFPQALESLRSNRRMIALWTGIIFLGWLLWSIVFVQIPGCVYHEKLARSRQNLHAVQLGLERFSVDSRSGTYPLDPAVLIEQGYLDNMPSNPFTGEPMRYVILTQPGYESRMPEGLSHGDFGYYPGHAYGGNPAPLDLGRLAPEDIEAYELVLY